MRSSKELERHALSCTLATYLAAPRANQSTVEPHSHYVVDRHELDELLECARALERLDKVAVDLGRAPGYDLMTWIRNLVLERTQLRARVQRMGDGHDQEGGFGGCGTL